MKNIHWKNTFFRDLSLDELYAIGQLRQEVFVVEQDCPYLDFDSKDQACWHLMGWQAKQLVGYARLVPKGISYPKDVSIGRVLTSQKIRGTGAGKLLMRKALTCCQELWPEESIRISAQDYLLKFYKNFGFEDTGKKYLEDGIPHTEMFLDATTKTIRDNAS